jgi:hypothetical protein
MSATATTPAKPISVVSPARIAANRANSLKSKGPTSISGKERSRCNGLKHGLTGQGIVVADQDAGEVDRRTATLMAELNPQSTIGQAMVGQLATLSVRMERVAKQEEQAIARRTRHAAEAFDHDRVDRAEDLFEVIADDPRWAVRMLKRSPEGVDRLVEAWAELRDVLTRSAKPFHWEDSHHAMLAQLRGFRPEQVAGTRLDQLSKCVLDRAALPDPEYAALAIPDRRGWARDRLVERIDEEVAALNEHRGTFDLEAIELDRLAAGVVAPFDASREACLARRYEAEARRGFYKALEKLRQAEAEAAECAESRPQPEPEPEPAPLGSSRAATSPTLGSSCAAPSPTPRSDSEGSIVPRDGAARGLDGRVIAVGRAAVVPG